MLKSALNALTAIHSRPAMLKRLGDPDIFTPARITPANFFRFLRGPEYTTVKGVEFVIPIDTLTGQFGQLLSFNTIPDEGTFKLQFGMNVTNDINFDATASDIQTELRLISPLANVLVTGSFLTGFRITFAGFDTRPEMGQVVDNLLETADVAVVPSWKNVSTVWSSLLEKGDRILDGDKVWSIDEIVEMHDLGAQVMAYRVRAD